MTDQASTTRTTTEQAIASATTEAGAPLAELSQGPGALVVFLRHSGCTFCREALGDLRERKPELDKAGVQPVLVHMGPPGSLDALLAKYGLAGAQTISDPSKSLYKAFELKRGGAMQLFGPRVWLPGLMATLRGHLVGKMVGDGFQMPGAFLVKDGRVARAFRHETVADRPDYAGLACGLDGAER